MLKVAKVGKGDVLYDLGSGDGRIPITAAQKYRIARGIGIDINPERIKEANENLSKARVGDRVRFVNADLFESDLSQAGYAHRFACIRHGKLEAAAGAEGRNAQRLLLDHSRPGYAFV